MVQTLIHKLDDDLINKIAAGEVIERPSSVVKELVENSLDAGATRVVVSLRDGGKKLIQVVDDGCGMSPDQLPLAMARHATSKIQNFDDLFCLKTNGFRGEALASIGSVAQVDVASKTAEHEASEIIVDGGEIIDQRAVAQPQGTRVTVKYLFHKTPARLKFLKSSATEVSHVTSVLTKLALSHPDISFELFHNDRSILNLKQHEDLVERTIALLGDDLKGYLYSFSGESPQMVVHGLVGHPQVSRSQRTSSFFFVNGRPVQDKVLWHAVMEAHRDLLMKGRYPVLVLNLSINEDLVDVNVHPTKAEIRFHQSQQVHQFVYRVLRDLLKSAPWLPTFQSQSNEDENAVVVTSSNPFEDDAFESARVVLDRNPSRLDQAVKQGIEQSLKNESQQPRWFDSLSSQNSFSERTKQPSASFQSTEFQKDISFGKTSYADMTPIGQLLGTYILAQSKNKLVLIDQHAAHERIGFEKLILQYQKDGVVSQPMLIPETFDLKPSDAEILKESLESLLEFGFEIEFFGGNTFVLKASPVLLDGKFNIKSLMLDLVEDLKASGELVSLKDRLHHVFATMACHAQIRAHHHLSFEEMKDLLRQLEDYQFTDFCPHGRPVSVEVTLDEIEKWFKRIL